MKYKTQKELDSRLDICAIENRCANFWENTNTYAYDATASRVNSFVVDTPPPTVSGSLHVGHIFSYTQTDLITRFQRMCGKSVFYPIGWDDNGLPTERRVQNYYNIACNPKLPYDPDFTPAHNPDDKSPRREVSRRNFIEACKILTEQDEKVFEDLFRRIGHSYDWNLKYSTISDEAIKLSQASFIDLFNKGHTRSVYAPTMWDVTFRSAIAQAEVEDREVDGFFHDLEFKVQGSDKTFVIATTRPELLPACIAIVAHPDDERYADLFGKNAIVPLFDVIVPIVPSEHAEKDKGTGIMMVCTFGDAADVAWWKQSGLPIKQIIGLDGHLMDVKFGEDAFETLNEDKANKNYSQLTGLSAADAKRKIVELLRADGALLGEPRPIKHFVKFYEKGNFPLEFVSSRQWFIKLLEHKDELVDAGMKINWKPSFMQARFVDWAKNLNQDWCISRQRFFGVPFPVWYKLDNAGNPDFDNPIIADLDQLPVDPMSMAPRGYTEDMRGKNGGFIGDPDVMDTWATSSLTPQLAMSIAPKGSDLSLPMDIRPQAHEIIRTWAFYTVAKALLHENKLPWYNALISGFILDPDRKKMSKSKGNVVTPAHLIDQYSADAVRYWAAKARLGMDTAFDEKMMSQGHKFIVKLFNASRFVFGIVGNSSVVAESDYKKYITNPMDKSWLHTVADASATATRAFNDYDYATALDVMESRFWNFCDNYLEIVKTRAYSDDSSSAIATLMFTIDVFVKHFAPFCPFITEEIFQSRPWGTSEKSLHNQSWIMEEDFVGITADDSVLYDSTVKVVSDIRGAKSENGKSQKTPVLSITISAPAQICDILRTGETDLINVGSVVPSGIKYVDAPEFATSDIVLDMDFVQIKK
ncbi:MAG: valine--tRNA ligase [Alphaproteobacteria bacterium]|nr:valine--tRNA ligase [Alphaproteobacteria bacterium]